MRCSPGPLATSSLLSQFFLRIDVMQCLTITIRMLCGMFHIFGFWGQLQVLTGLPSVSVLLLRTLLFALCSLLRTLPSYISGRRLLTSRFLNCCEISALRSLVLSSRFSPLPALWSPSFPLLVASCCQLSCVFPLSVIYHLYSACWCVLSVLCLPLVSLFRENTGGHRQTNLISFRI